MPEILDLLKTNKRMETKAIIEEMHSVAARKGLFYRGPAVSHSLTVLKWMGWISNDATGVWSITAEGFECPSLTENRSRQIGREKDAAIKRSKAAKNLLVDRLSQVRQMLENELEKAEGFESDPKIRRMIEVHAMCLVEREYSRRGYAVEDKHATESYDLLCEKEGSKIFVEVKGTRTNGNFIILTANEVELAANPSSRTDLCVVHSIILLGETPTGGRLERYEYWNPAAHDLRSVSYQCCLSKKLATIP
jgi:hypothetical protein